MSFLDLTGRHTFTAVGTPALVAGSGVGLNQVTHFDGAGDWIQSVDALTDFTPGLGDFCVEIAVRIERYNVVLVDFFRSLHAGWQLWIPANGVVQWWRGNASYLDGSAVPLGQFCTLAADRRAGVLRLLVNGAVVAEAADVFDYSYVMDVFALGAQVAQRNSVYDLQGDIGWARVTRASRYASTYVPSLPFAAAGDPLWGQTVLLFVSGNVEGESPTVVVVDPVQTAVGMGLEQVGNGVFDLVFYDPETDDRAVETLVYAVLFTNAEGPVAREPDRYARQGWWLDAEAGSGLWHVRRQPLGSAARREALEMVRQALEDHTPALSGVSVVESARSAGLVSSVVMEITGFYSGRQFVVSVPL